jgi:hypothetical protein
MPGFHYQNSTRPLTLKQQRFLAGYQAHGNATRAAHEAGFSQRHAGTAGWRLLQHPLVRAALASPTGGQEGLELPSGLLLAFSYRGRPVSPDLALEISKIGASVTELGIWRGGLATLALLAHELDRPEE